MCRSTIASIPRLASIRRWPVGILLVVTMGLPSHFGTLANGQGRQEIVIRTGDPLPGGPEAAAQFDSLLQNGTGLISFGNSFSTGGEGLYHADSTAITKVVRTGDPVAGGGTFDAFNTLETNDLGRSSFVGFLTGTPQGTLDDTGLFAVNGAAIAQIARERQSAAGNGQFVGFSAGARPKINDQNQVFFFGSTSGSVGGSADNIGVFRGNGGPVSKVLRKGESALGNGTFNILSLFDVNDNNQISIFASLAGTSGGTANDTGIFRTDGTTLVQIAREGQAAHGFTMSNLSQSSFINNAGQVAFMATLGGNEAVLRGSGGATTLLAIEGQAAPEGNGTLTHFAFGSFNDFNANGKALYHGLLSGSALGDADDEGIYLTNGITTQTMAREGNASPSGSGVLAGFDGTIVNDRDVVLYQTKIGSTVGAPPTETGIFLTDGTQTIEAVRQPGFQLGFTRELNDAGQFAYSRLVINGASAVVELLQFTPDLHWRTPGSGTWDSDTRWTLGIKPAAVHDVVIDPQVNVSVTGPAANTTVRSLTIGGGNGAAELQLNTGIQLTATKGVEVANHGKLVGPGVINGDVENSSGGQILVPAERSLTILRDLNQDGTLTIENNGTPASLTVDGTFSGNGGFNGGGDLILKGDVQPGNSVGIIQGEGNLQLKSDSRTVIELAGIGSNNYDRIELTGNLKIEGRLAIESLNGFLPRPGNEFLIARVEGTVTGEFQNLSEGDLVRQIDLRQLFVSYRGGDGNDISVSTLSAADFDRDGDLDCTDVDALVSEIATQGNREIFDLDRNAQINVGDLRTWLIEGGSVNLSSGNSYRNGDANLDGVVDGSDFNIWNSHKFTRAASWCQGDFSADGVIDGSDFNIWNANKFTSSDSTSVVPEPTMMSVGLLLLPILLRKRPV